jgi:hypothetical protein
MWEPARPLAVSPAERAILEAMIGSDEIARRVRKRARVVLMAAQGVANHQIAQDVRMARARVLYWRRRFAEQGIRGLWDVESVPPQERVPEEIEQAVVFDCLYRPRLSGQVFVQQIRDPSLTWNVKNLARRHGISAASVQRIRDKHGIRMRRLYRLDIGVELGRLKISQDPLFAVTVYELGGLFHEGVGSAVAFCSRERPFSEVTLASLDREAREGLVARLIARFREVDRRSFGRPEPASGKFIEFVSTLAAKPRHRNAEIHLIVERHERGAHACPEVKTWLAGQKCIRVHYTPWDRAGRNWIDLAQRWLDVIAAWPMQASLVESLSQMTRLLEQLPEGKYLDTLVIRQTSG